MTRLNSLTDRVSKGSSLLDIAMLQIGENITCVAYVLDCKLKMSVNMQGYATFVLKDMHSNIISARLFNLDDYFESGFVAAAFKGKLVTFTAEVQEFNGSLSLIINGTTGVNVYTGDADIAQFIGRFDVDLSVAEELFRGCFPDKPFPAQMYKTLGISFLANGKVGAFAKIFDMALGNIMGLSGFSGIKEAELLNVYFTVMQHYCNILISYTSFSELVKLQFYKEYNIIEMSEEQEYSLIVIDTLQALLEHKKPLHLIAHVIVGAVTGALNAVDLVEQYSSIAKGMSAKVYLHDCIGGFVSTGGAELLKY